MLLRSEIKNNLLFNGGSNFKGNLGWFNMERFVLLRLDTTPLVSFSVFYIYHRWLHLLQQFQGLHAKLQLSFLKNIPGITS